MDLEKLDDLIRIYRNHSIDDFLSVWLEVSVASRTANDVPRAKADVVAVYVARLLAANDVDAVLTDLRSDKRVRARDCIEIATRLAPSGHRPKSRNRALQAIHSRRAMGRRGNMRCAQCDEGMRRRDGPAARHHSGDEPET